MKIFQFAKRTTKALLARWQVNQTLTRPHHADLLPYNMSSWSNSLVFRSEYYLNCVRYFYQKSPPFIRKHREYFKEGRRGFGEDAFHVMWHALCNVCRPRSFLEIGVYRGQTLSLISLATKSLGIECAVCGVSPFSDAGDSVSKYSSSVDYWQDTLKNFEAFDLPVPELIRGMSNDEKVVQKFSNRLWDLIYIDGNHEYEVAKADFINCSKILSPGGKIVLDDSALYTSFRPPLYATAGHPGPSRLAKEIGSFGFQEVLCVGHNRVFQKQL